MTHAVRAGVVASAGLAIAYVLVVRTASGSTDHLLDQIRSDWYLLAPIVLAFGAQVALFLELRRRRALHPVGTAAASLGSGTSAAGMVACCAHHIAELAPFLGLSAAAPFLYGARAWFMLLGLSASGVGIALALRRLRQLPALPPPEEGSSSCEGH